jgi:hypothetical protein
MTNDASRGSDDGVYHLESLGFWTLPIVRNSKYQENTNAPSSVEGRETSTLSGPLERASLNH